MTDDTAGRRVALRADASAQVGAGHAMRCLALAEGLRDAGWAPRLVGDIGGVELVERVAAKSGIPVGPAPADPRALVAMLRADGFAAIVLDGYGFPPDTAHVLRDTGTTVAAIGDLPDQWPDVPLVVNQNYGAERVARPAPGQRLLAGVRYALLRDTVRSRRPAAPRHVQGPAREVLVVFGGTDAAGAAPLTTSLLLRTGRQIRVTVVAPRPSLAAAVEALPTGPGQRVRVLRPVDDLAALAVGADLVVSAAGSGVWELACLGVPAALVCVAANQQPGYLALVTDRVAAGLGQVESIRADPSAAIAVLGTLVDDDEERRRLSRVGWQAVDGRGRVRVADALAALVV